ncbi:MAG TPA: peptide ABC transporter substrate-binding protein [Leucothrix mucor]|nr:peptide ABC transporter substrate-binding protein [Leucothrix mucor]
MSNRFIFLITCFCWATVSVNADNWNNPHPATKAKQDVLFSSFSLPPKHLDPVISYSSNEWAIISHVYEPPLQYNYLKRPYELEPLTLTQMPSVRYLDKENNEVDKDSSAVVFSEYTLTLRDDITFQNHPSFTKDNEEKLLYGNLNETQIADISSLDDFKKTASRGLLASDYEYAIKRMAVRQYHSPILDTMTEYVVGLSEYSKEITAFAKQKKKDKQLLDLRSHKISGVTAVDDHTLRIKIKGHYPQFLYWLSMNFFAPIPWEADLFYQQPALIKKNLTLNWFPVGTGPYMLVENNPNKQMRLLKNPNYHDDFYPKISAEEAKKSAVPAELLKDAGQKMPFINEVIYSLEKESIPLWNKFLQGYYDASGISSESFDQVVQVSSSGAMGLSQEMKDKGISLRGSIQPTVYYMAFNMVDPVIGGYTESAKKLRQAISIAIDQEEYISIFRNERGLAAQGPIPPGIFGHKKDQAGTNTVVYNWKNGERVRKPLDDAKKLMAEAGYPNGVAKDTGKPLTLYYDSASSGPDSRAEMDWYRKQFSKLGIQLVIRATDYNRFQDKVRKAKTQIFSWGWNADYPDPENFLFLLYGGNATSNTNGSGINSSNYQNPEFDKLFDEIKTMENSPERLSKVKQMIQIARQDSPWVWGFHPKSMGLFHSWYGNVLPNDMANNTLKYKRINGDKRVAKQQKWNKPVIWPLAIFVLFILLSIYPLYRAYQSRQKAVVNNANNNASNKNKKEEVA